MGERSGLVKESWSQDLPVETGHSSDAGILYG